jgi:hypothetical protein
MKDREGGAKVLKPETWLNLHFDFNKALLSPGSIEISSFTTATQALDEPKFFVFFVSNKCYFRITHDPICSGAVIIFEVVPNSTPLRTSFISWTVYDFIMVLIDWG